MKGTPDGPASRFCSYFTCPLGKEPIENTCKGEALSKNMTRLPLKTTEEDKEETEETTASLAAATKVSVDVSVCQNWTSFLH